MHSNHLSEMSLPLRYRLYAPIHRGFTALGHVTVAGKHPFIVLRNHLNRVMYRCVLTEQTHGTVLTRSGFRIRVPLGDQAAASIVFERQYAPEESGLIRRLLSACDAFLDAGANLGYFSLLAHSVLEGRGVVITVEPNPCLCALIRESMALNGYPSNTVWQAGVGAAPGQAWFVVDPRRSSCGRIILEPDPAGTPVPVVRIDDLIAPQRLDLRWLIKIDVEGLEAQVIAGCTDAMARGAIFLCEVFATSAEQVQNTIRSQGYTLLDHRGMPLPAEVLRRKRRQDVIMVPAARAEWLQHFLQSRGKETEPSWSRRVTHHANQ
ncbi:MAG: FkbM family methyltransferase [Chloroherpetonaceae bacterium]|nr:FkbM family methyltransferase [Chthonomonadaceae bacterium]MDW8206692.1 FkbM family methyltransferase [Chloroherpetonaceae bacterium]